MEPDGFRNEHQRRDRDISYFHYDEEEALYTNPLIDRFVERIIKTFQQWGRSQGNGLSGRAKAIIPRIDQVISELYSFEKSSENCESTSELFVQFIVSPLIREGVKLRIEVIASQQPLPHELMSRYILWIDRSYRWINRFYTCENEELGKAIVNHITHETAVNARKDLELIQEYIEQQIAVLAIGEVRGGALSSAILLSIHDKLLKIKKLETDLPQSSSPHDVKRWRQSTDAVRQQLFDDSLGMIDRYIENEFPKPERKHVQRHLRTALEKILSLENSVQEMIDSEKKESSQVERWQNKRKVLALHQQAHNISLDIRLSQELFDRVQKIMEKLVAYYEEY